MTLTLEAMVSLLPKMSPKSDRLEVTKLVTSATTVAGVDETVPTVVVVVDDEDTIDDVDEAESVTDELTLSLLTSDIVEHHR